MSTGVITRKVFGWVWATLTAPIGFFVFVATICGSPAGCVHNAADGFFLVLVYLIPILFLISAIVGIRAKETDLYLKKSLVFLPILFVALYLVLVFGPSR